MRIQLKWIVGLACIALLACAEPGRSRPVDAAVDAADEDVPSVDSGAGGDVEPDAALNVCGDGTQSDSEACDDGNTESGDGCSADCASNETCGNGVTDETETCDDGNTESADGCSADCASNETCGNSITDTSTGEVCDDGNTDAGDGCSVDCGSDETCGNGMTDAAAGEVCDDGNRTDGDGCAANCLSDETCGNGIRDGAEACDDGNRASGDGCSSDCTSDETCGNGSLDAAAGEICDDGNLVSGDGCSLDCASDETCGNGITDTAASEVCDDGNVVGGDGCAANCRSHETCGNGITDTDAGEACDDGGTVGGDGCSADCSSDETCGNGVIDSDFGEVCDDGNNADADGCAADCSSDETCGNGIVDSLAGEVCDDSNVADGDGCSSSCLSDETCGNGIVDAAAFETCDDGNASNADDCPDGIGGSCTPASCLDGFTHSGGSGTETDVDCGGTCLACPGGLLLSEFVVTPTDGEFVEIHNPMASEINLSHVYLADYNTYYLLTIGAGGPNASDFRVQFPNGTSISAGAYVTIGRSASGFFSVYGANPDFDLDVGDADAPAMRGEIGGSRGLTNSGEMLVLFTWNGEEALVRDIDYALYGNSSNAMDKTGQTVGASAFAGEVPTALQAFTTSPGSGSSASRCDFTEGSEMLTGGNGYTGHDETSEPLTATWETSATPSPGTANVCAP